MHAAKEPTCSSTSARSPTANCPQPRLTASKGWENGSAPTVKTVYGVRAADFPAQSWGTATRKGDKLYLHVFRPEGNEITVPLR